MIESLIGWLAGVLTTIAFLPQVTQIWRTRSTQDISLGMYLIFTLGVALWLIYGLLLKAWPIIIANAITLLFSGSILVLKLKDR